MLRDSNKKTFDHHVGSRVSQPHEGGTGTSLATAKDIWDRLNDPSMNRTSSVQWLRSALRQLPQGRLDLSQQPPLTEKALSRLIKALTRDLSAEDDGPLLKQLVLGRVENLEALVEWWRFSVETLDLSHLRVGFADCKHGNFEPPSLRQVKKMQIEAMLYEKKYPLKTIIVNRSTTLQWHLRRWMKLKTEVAIVVVDVGCTAQEREDMYRRVLQDILDGNCIEGVKLNLLLDDPGFADQRELDLNRMINRYPPRWPGLKALLASPHCPVRTLVLPPPSGDEIVRAFDLDRRDTKASVQKYFESLFGAPGQEAGARVRFEAVCLDGWSESELKHLPDDDTLNGWPVHNYFILTPSRAASRREKEYALPDTSIRFAVLLPLVSSRQRLRLSKAWGPGEKERYSSLCWHRLLAAHEELPPHAGHLPEFSNARLDFYEKSGSSHCERETWLHLAKLLKDEACPLKVLVFGQTSGSKQHGGRLEFLSTFVPLGRKLDLGDWVAESLELAGPFTEFGPHDIDHLLTLEVPKETVIVLSDECIDQMRLPLDQLVRKGWLIEDRKGLRLTPMASAEEPSDGAWSRGTGPDAVSAEVQKKEERSTLPLDRPGVPNIEFDSRKETIQRQIERGMHRALEMALTNWLSLEGMSVAQLTVLQTMANRYSTEASEDVKAAARVLNGALQGLLSEQQKPPSASGGPIVATKEPSHEVHPASLRNPQGSAPSEQESQASQGLAVGQNDKGPVRPPTVRAGQDTAFFNSRKDSIKLLIERGMSGPLKQSLTTWLKLDEMSREQLQDLLALANTYDTNASAEIKDAATVLANEAREALQRIG